MMKKQAIFKKIRVRFASLVIKTKKGKKKLKKMFKISEKLLQLGYPYGYNLMDEKIVNTLKDGLIDSSKSVRAILWNSISIISTLITSE